MTALIHSLATSEALREDRGLAHNRRTDELRHETQTPLRPLSAISHTSPNQLSTDSGIHSKILSTQSIFMKFSFELVFRLRFSMPLNIINPKVKIKRNKSSLELLNLISFYAFEPIISTK